MTQAQHSDIVTLLTQKCQLIETAFIAEMTDHFVISIETRMAESFSFHEALQLTVEDFGGRRNIQKMEWTFRKAFMKNQLRDLWSLVKSQFSKPKLIRSMIIVGLVILVSLYFGLTSLIGVGERQILLSALKGFSIAPIVSITWFLLQHLVPPFKKAGVLRSPHLLNTILSYLLVASTVLISLGISTVEIPMLLKALSYLALWSMLAILYLAFLDYSVKTTPELWYQTKKADQ